MSQPAAGEYTRSVGDGGSGIGNIPCKNPDCGHPFSLHEEQGTHMICLGNSPSHVSCNCHKFQS